MENPLGYSMNEATVSWVAGETESLKQKAAQVVVATDPAMEDIIYDSGMCDKLDSRATILPIKLAPKTRYYWTVTVEGDKGDTATSGVNWFETAKMDEAWSGKWISPPWEHESDDCVHPYIRKQHDTDKQVAKARAYITGMGVYEFYINGKRVGDEYLAPYCNTYSTWVQYQTYDVTENLANNNVFGVMLANGWAKGRFGTFGDLNYPYTRRLSLICEIHITYTDGTTEVVGTDESWLCAPSPILFDNIYDGIIYDANKEIADWCKPGICTESWQNANVITPTELGPLMARLSLPVKCMEEIKPIELIKTPAGETVIDMGQNMVGWIKIRVNAPKGTTIKLTHGEILQKSNFFRDNLRSAKAEYIYISDGTPQTVEARFTFYGFRYAKVEGIENVNLDDFTGCVLYSEMETIGNISTSNATINRLFQNVLWGQKGNFLDVPTDCPQRDERMGWTGDTQVFAGTALFNTRAYPFYTKFMYDLHEDQKLSDGMVAHVVPRFVEQRPQETSFTTGGAVAWADCATVVPWQAYLHTGDAAILKAQFQSMKDWVDWVTRKCKADNTGYLWLEGFHFGDWLSLDSKIDENGIMSPFGGTDDKYLASAYYKLSSELVAKAARVLGLEKEAQEYQTLSDNIKAAVLEKYFNPDGSLNVKHQTAHVIALQFEIAENREKIVADLKAMLEANNMHLQTGFIGTPYLCRTLSDNGYEEAAYHLFFNEEYPSWIYPISMGATTIWERWNSVLPNGELSDLTMNSLNHYAYGSIAEWMYRNMCGINPVEESPGFKKILLKPSPNKRLDFAKAEVNTSMGLVKCGWEYNADGSVTISAEVPFDTEAEVILPNGETKTLKAGKYSF